MNERIVKLMTDVVDSNPGALMVVNKLMYFTKWHDMMKWLLREKYVGSKLWELYKDEYRENIFDLGNMIKLKLYDERMAQVRKSQNQPDKWGINNLTIEKE